MITCEKVRRLALVLPEAEEREHWGHPSFRVRNKIFATMREDERRAVLKLSQADQMAVVSLTPETFSTGPWSHQGWTFVNLKSVRQGEFEQLLIQAWRQVAPKRVIAAYDAQKSR